MLIYYFYSTIHHILEFLTHTQTENSCAWIFLPNACQNIKYKNHLKRHEKRSIPIRFYFIQHFLSFSFVQHVDRERSCEFYMRLIAERYSIFICKCFIISNCGKVIVGDMCISAAACT